MYFRLILTILGGVNTNLGVRGTGGGGLNPHGRGAGIQSNNLILLILFLWLPRHLANEIITIRLIRMKYFFIFK